ncbi:MAG TPA: Gfo/Idh/MocA family oxidoreductase [Candidatus Hydrogenedentes bacterium]|nr:Gfo/Idh/MocA family oxidoreductase [Candidatus Hydrogenedentota bacterium]HOJ67777.1 Gfo/Idh/MocA family oxidoreductase [Candidatus Hydrogenedentota bacterium]HOK89833.1 Gfo/Idh/MocA family oxidoreductase [Candidatus Hydrogenedentota bacterium]
MDTLRVGFVGLGGICRQRHVPGLRKISGIELRAVVNRTRESSEKAARDFDIPVVCDTWQELVARDDIDVVFVGTWPYLHREVSVAALNAGKHVFCQARMAMDLADARPMLETARRSGKVAGLCPVPFGLSVDRTVVRLLREGAIGQVRHVCVQSTQGTWRDPAAPVSWRKDHRLSGLNMQTLGMWIEVLHRWLGMTRWVTAETQIFTPKRPDGQGGELEIRIPDQLTALAGFENEITAGYFISGMCDRTEECVLLHGDKGVMRYDALTDRLTVSGTRREQVITPPPEEAYDVQNWRVEADFIAAIREGLPYHPDFEDGIRYMAVIQAMYDSAADGRRREIVCDWA